MPVPIKRVERCANEHCKARRVVLFAEECRPCDECKKNTMNCIGVVYDEKKQITR